MLTSLRFFTARESPTKNMNYKPSLSLFQLFPHFPHVRAPMIAFIGKTVLDLDKNPSKWYFQELLLHVSGEELAERTGPWLQEGLAGRYGNKAAATGRALQSDQGYRGKGMSCSLFLV